MIEKCLNNTKVSVINDDTMEDSEIIKYIDYIKEQTNQNVKELTITIDENDEVDLDYVLQTPKFERIRRITGYLTGTLDSWNNSKRTEEKERVKHSVDGYNKQEFKDDLEILDFLERKNSNKIDRDCLNHEIHAA